MFLGEDLLSLFSFLDVCIQLCLQIWGISAIVSLHILAIPFFLWDFYNVNIGHFGQTGLLGSVHHFSFFFLSAFQTSSFLPPLPFPPLPFPSSLFSLPFPPFLPYFPSFLPSILTQSLTCAGPVSYHLSHISNPILC
jgi:hypothetical protein